MCVIRKFRDGSTQDWWALEIVAGPSGPDKTQRAAVATTDPQTLPDLITWYLVTNLPAPIEHPVTPLPFPPAFLEEVIRLSGLRQWAKQSYKQVKHALGWSQYQVRSDQAIRRHWQLVCCAFSFCWHHASHSLTLMKQTVPEPFAREGGSLQEVPADGAGTGEKISEEKAARPQMSWPVALRTVRGWLEPWIMLRRSWNGGRHSLYLLLRCLEQGQAIALYSSA